LSANVHSNTNISLCAWVFKVMQNCQVKEIIMRLFNTIYTQVKLYKTWKISYIIADRIHAIYC